MHLNASQCFVLGFFVFGISGSSSSSSRRSSFFLRTRKFCRAFCVSKDGALCFAFCMAFPEAAGVTRAKVEAPPSSLIFNEESWELKWGKLWKVERSWEMPWDAFITSYQSVGDLKVSTRPRPCYCFSWLGWRWLKVKDVERKLNRDKET